MYESALIFRRIYI